MRPYQQAGREKIHSEWDAGRRSTLLVLPTGTGKTIVMAAVAEDQVLAGQRVLILAHRGELLDQASDKILNATGLRCAVEKAEQSCLDSYYRITVGSVQSLMRPKRLDQFPPDYFGAIFIDEAHHAITDGYRRILDHFPGAHVLGVTATPDRGDMRNLGEVFDSLAYEYKLTQAIRDGYLCKIMAQTLPLKLDISTVGMSGGDYAVQGLGTALDPYLDQIAAQMATYDSRKTRSQHTPEEDYAMLEDLARGYYIQAVVVDPAAAAFIETIRRHGRFLVRPAENDVINGIQTTAALLQSGRVLIHEGCADTLREFKTYSWDDTAHQDKVIKENDHAMDDIRYFCMTILAREYRWADWRRRV